MECNFDSDICKTTVRPHRFQILPNAVTCGLSDVLYVVVSISGIIYITLVHISDVAMSAWLHTLRTLIHKCVKWILDVSFITILMKLAYASFSIDYNYRTAIHFLNYPKVWLR